MHPRLRYRMKTIVEYVTKRWFFDLMRQLRDIMWAGILISFIKGAEMRIFHVPQYCTRTVIGLCVSFGILSLHGSLIAQTSPCGYATSNVCTGSCSGSYFLGFRFQNGGPNYGITATVFCNVSCPHLDTNIYQSSQCTMGTLSANLTPQIIERLLALGNGKEILIPACGGGFEPLKEAPVTVAQNRRDFLEKLPLRY